MNNVERLWEQGQSIWFDFIRRDLLEDGELKRLIDLGLRGMTSNPTIFEKAIDGSDDYDQAIREFPHPEDTSALYDALTWADIGLAADLFRPLYDASGGQDGFVSIEVSPTLARDTKGTVVEARRIWRALARPNIMIKVPATEEGIPAILTLIQEGLNVNVTLIFALERYRQVIDAYWGGLQARADEGKPIDRVASVASFFVSRVDTLVDHLLEEREKASPADRERLRALHGQAAVANAREAYALFTDSIADARAHALIERGAQVQRPLWASTSTKNPAYPDLLYVDSLIGPHTVNTVPPATWEGILDHAQVARTVDRDLDRSRETLASLEAAGISMRVVTQQLEEEGVKSFADSFTTLMEGLEKKARAVSSRP